MFLEIDRAEECMLEEIVAAELARLEGRVLEHPTGAATCFDPEQRVEILKRLQRHLTESEFDVTC